MTSSEKQVEQVVWYPVEKRTGRWRAVWLGVVLGVVVTAVLGIGAGVWFFLNAPTILPGTAVLGVEIGGLTEGEAAGRLASDWQARQIWLNAGTLSVTAVSPDDLGITLDAQATARRAYQQTRSFDGLLAWLQGTPPQAVPIWQIDLDVARAKLAELAPQFEQAPVNAGIRIENGRVVTTPPISGQALDVDATINWLALHAADAVTGGQVPVFLQSTQPAIMDVGQAVTEAERLLQHTVTLSAYDPVTDETFTELITPAVWGSWLTLTVQPGSLTDFRWTLDEQKAGEALAAIAAGWGNGRRFDTDAVVTAAAQAIQTQETAVYTRLYHTDRTHIVQAGETLASIGRRYGIPYPWIQQANPGVENLAVGQTLTIPSPDVMLPLPVIENKRIVVSISEQHTWVYENGTLKWSWPASTGIDDSPTAPGVFQVQSHEPLAYAANWDLWMPSFMGIYRPVPTADFMNGFHGFPSRNGSQLLWTGNLGTKVTYGCILLSSENAALLYDWAEEGVVVEIRP